MHSVLSLKPDVTRTPAPVHAAMIWDSRLEEDGDVLGSNSARWSPTASMSASTMAEWTERV